MRASKRQGAPKQTQASKAEIALQAELKEVREKLKKFQSKGGEQANQASAGTQGKKGDDKSPKECFSVKRLKACPNGAQCRWTHDPSLGDVANKTLPNGYKCYFCDSTKHWKTECKSDEAKAWEMTRKLKEKHFRNGKKKEIGCVATVVSDG
jgi:hypothetical protein